MLWSYYSSLCCYSKRDESQCHSCPKCYLISRHLTCECTWQGMRSTLWYSHEFSPLRLPLVGRSQQSHSCIFGCSWCQSMRSLPSPSLFLQSYGKWSCNCGLWSSLASQSRFRLYESHFLCLLWKSKTVYRAHTHQRRPDKEASHGYPFQLSRRVRSSSYSFSASLTTPLDRISFLLMARTLACRSRLPTSHNYCLVSH